MQPLSRATIHIPSVSWPEFFLPSDKIIMDMVMQWSAIHPEARIYAHYITNVRTFNERDDPSQPKGRYAFERRRLWDTEGDLDIYYQ